MIMKTFSVALLLVAANDIVANESVVSETGVTAEDIEKCKWLVNGSAWYWYAPLCQSFCDAYATDPECNGSLRELNTCVMTHSYCAFGLGCHPGSNKKPECLDWDKWVWPDKVVTNPWPGSQGVWDNCRVDQPPNEKPTTNMEWTDVEYHEFCLNIIRHSAGEDYDSQDKCQFLCNFIVYNSSGWYRPFTRRSDVVQQVFEMVPECLQKYVDCEYLGTLSPYDKIINAETN